MKLLSRKKRDYFKRIQRFRELPRIKLNSLKNRKNENHRKASKIDKPKVIIDLKFASHITILNPKLRKKLRKITKKFREYYFRKDVCLRLNFKDTKQMFSDGTLYLLAELETLTLINPDITFGIIPSDEKIVNQVLEQTGILKLLKQSIKFEDDEFDESVKYWNYSSGHNSEIDSADSMLDDFDEILSEDTSKNIFTSLTEALTNCHHHAYEERRIPTETKSIKKWWLFSQERDGVLTVCVCDLGIGIPRSLTRNTSNVKEDWFTRLKGFIKENKGKYDKDSAAIKAAIEIGNTRTNLPNRGKGLNQIINKINTMCDHRASIAIYSNKGSYIINRGFVTDLPTTDIINGIAIPYTESIEGTVIVWQIPLDKQNQVEALVTSDE
ncbi:hypothetical protein QR674_05055 [Acinetobacter chinensis]|uniref:ATP-binding protein n=1 Tax=Acinetobacter chinensis TaxID=2004650 RepID=A0ABU3WD55_9GAMM|nr:hypothetical protein [Acinetobacter chinensis]MDV2468346.1 hypothetical protein [Acinetobacter chinensis]